MSNLEFCISREEWDAADGAGKEALNQRAVEAYWNAFEVVHQNSNWGPVETNGVFGIGAIKKPNTFKGSEFDPYGGHSKASRWGAGDMHAGAMAYKRAPKLVGTGASKYPASSVKKYPFCPTL